MSTYFLTQNSNFHRLAFNTSLITIDGAKYTRDNPVLTLAERIKRIAYSCFLYFKSFIFSKGCEQDKRAYYYETGKFGRDQLLQIADPAPASPERAKTPPSIHIPQSLTPSPARTPSPAAPDENIPPLSGDLPSPKTPTARVASSAGPKTPLSPLPQQVSLPDATPNGRQTLETVMTKPSPVKTIEELATIITLSPSKKQGSPQKPMRRDLTSSLQNMESPQDPPQRDLTPSVIRLDKVFAAEDLASQTLKEEITRHWEINCNTKGIIESNYLPKLEEYRVWAEDVMKGMNDLLEGSHPKNVQLTYQQTCKAIKAKLMAIVKYVDLTKKEIGVVGAYINWLVLQMSEDPKQEFIAFVAEGLKKARQEWLDCAPKESQYRKIMTDDAQWGAENSAAITNMFAEWADKMEARAESIEGLESDVQRIQEDAWPEYAKRVTDEEPAAKKATTEVLHIGRRTRRDSLTGVLSPEELERLGANK